MTKTREEILAQMKIDLDKHDATLAKMNAALKIKEPFIRRFDAEEMKGRRVFALRRNGASAKDIAETLELPIGEVVESVKRELARVSVADREEVLKLEISRLDDYLLYLYPAILTGDIKAINTALSIHRERAQLLGLYSPLKVDVRQFTKLDAEIDTLLAEMQAAAPRSARSESA